MLFGQTSGAPVVVSGGQKFRVPQAGGVAGCGITLGGVPMCCGGNSMGAVGAGERRP